jgi:pSer/pThr/pTyr-binding forkhead associated (FHA) protein
MKVKLIVVQGRPEGKEIPLVGPVFKIGRGETCHLRPNSEQVSREHAEFTLTEDSVSVCDLGSRNGTLVNGKALTETCQLKDRDLVQVGPLTFAVSIEGAPASAKSAAAGPPSKTAPEDVSHDDIEAWLISDGKSAAPERPSGVYPGDTITITAFKDAAGTKPPAPAPALAPTPPAVAADDDSDEEYERLPEGEGDAEEDEERAEDVAASASADEMPGEFIDESNPFYVKKKAPESSTPTKPVYKDTSDAATDILRKMMERRKSSR